MPRFRCGTERVLPGRQEILDSIRLACFGGPATIGRWARNTGFSTKQFYKFFDSWYDALEEAGIERRRAGRRKFSDDELLAEYHRVVEQIGRFPSVAEFNRVSTTGHSVMYLRFGRVPEIRAAYKRWLSARTLRETQEKDRAEQAAARAEEERSRNPTKLADDRPRPQDVDPVRWLMRTWFDLRVGFELVSSDFRGRSVADCDVLVVLEHDWPGCPVKVLELRQVWPEVELDGLQPPGERGRSGGATRAGEAVGTDLRTRGDTT